MSRPQTNPDEAFGSDSFLDIVANMVGILIILVIIAGLQARGVPEKLLNVAADIANDVQAMVAKGRTIEDETKKLSQQTEIIQQTQTALEAEQQQLLAARDQLKGELDGRRKDLDVQAQKDFDLRRKLAMAQNRWQRVDAEYAEAGKAKPEATTTKIESYPTPLSQTVAGREMHFQLKNGRITYVPLDELVDLYKHEIRYRAHQLRDRDETTDTIGPIEGFRMSYVLERVIVPEQVSSGGITSRAYARLEEFYLVPTNEVVGETREEAFQPGSRFTSKMADRSPEKTTVTLWTYSDSFGLYREMRKQLYLKGFTVAGRPLPDGQPIGGSPQGTKSAAQ